MLVVKNSYSRLTFPFKKCHCTTDLIKGTSALTGSACAVLQISVCGEERQNWFKPQRHCFNALTTYLCNTLGQTLFTSRPQKRVLDFHWRLWEDLIITVKIGSLSVPFHLVNAFVTGKWKKKGPNWHKWMFGTPIIFKHTWIRFLIEQAKTYTEAFVLCSLWHFEPTLAEVAAENKTVLFYFFMPQEHFHLLHQRRNRNTITIKTFFFLSSSRGRTAQDCWLLW